MRLGTGLSLVHPIQDDLAVKFVPSPLGAGALAAQLAPGSTHRVAHPFPGLLGLVVLVLGLLLRKQASLLSQA